VFWTGAPPLRRRRRTDAPSGPRRAATRRARRAGEAPRLSLFHQWGNLKVRKMGVAERFHFDTAMLAPLNLRAVIFQKF